MELLLIEVFLLDVRVSWMIRVYRKTSFARIGNKSETARLQSVRIESWWKVIVKKYPPTQLLQVEQWDDLGGRKSLQVKQNLSCTVCPRISTSRTRGPPAPRTALEVSLPFCEASNSRVISASTCAASSGVARGNIPGSLQLVRSKHASTKKSCKAPNTGTHTLKCTTKYGQLHNWKKWVG